MKVYINLTDFEMEVIVPLLAQWRRDANRRNAVVDKIISKEPGFKIDCDGVKGELVWAKYLNVYPDFSTKIRSGGAELTYKGWRIDAKFKNHNWGDMLTPIDTPADKTDIYANARGDNPYELVGWCYSHELIKDENIVTENIPVPSYKLQEYRLHHPNELLHIMYNL